MYITNRLHIIYICRRVHRIFPRGGKIQQNITLCARSAHKVKSARARRARFFFTPPLGHFTPPPQRESRVIFPRHFHSKHIGTLSLQSKEKHTFCPTRKQKIYLTSLYCVKRDCENPIKEIFKFFKNL